MPNTSQITPGNALKTLKLIHLALLLGQVMFGAVAFLQIRNLHFDLDFNGQPLMIVVAVLAVSAFTVGNLLFNKQLEAAVSRTSLTEKLSGYQTAMIIRLALIEGPSMLGIVGFLISGNWAYLIVSGVLVFWFVILRPTKDKIETDLNGCRAGYTELIKYHLPRYLQISRYRFYHRVYRQQDRTEDTKHSVRLARY
ncbi:hypothetical protein [Mucilaginibacter myungsuensis]|uniref:Uncharacterized protein n=1 Tax=Mucilaginibacter myungsuensis TaxID=649104 RepID=A0A929KXU3_9SPHI|nr:hypothetical protein [Mucilaginibacter myungsuensis]MBE9662642.1 hypothetical protein [Mucilaginibacter myungsuensis]MDN3598062.1 hypothetical protein [Mucilaginibacter myungsuensis]